MQCYQCGWPYWDIRREGSQTIYTSRPIILAPATGLEPVPYGLEDRRPSIGPREQAPPVGLEPTAFAFEAQDASNYTMGA